MVTVFFCYNVYVYSSNFCHYVSLSILTLFMGDSKVYCWAYKEAHTNQQSPKVLTMETYRRPSLTWSYLQKKIG